MAKPLVMGILNVTPDSFSDGGDHASPLEAIRRGREMFSQGADIVDVGGESTRPGAHEVSAESECERVLAVVEALSAQGVVSIDTRKQLVAQEALNAGATIVNDVSASLAHVAGKAKAGWVAMHMQGLPDTMQNNPSYSDVTEEVSSYLVAKANKALELGVSQVWLDPGFGFGKTFEHNMILLANIDHFVKTGFPIAIGISRKSMLGQILAMSDGQPNPVVVEDRLVGSLISAAFAMINEVNLVRVHDVAETLRVRALINRSW